MLETILSILAAAIVIFVAGLLVRWQNKQEVELEELGNEIDEAFGEAVINYRSLTGEDPTEETISGLENDLAKLNNRLLQIKEESHQHSLERSKHRYVKRKKGFTDD